MSKKLNWILIIASVVILGFAIYTFLNPGIFAPDIGKIKNDNSLTEKQAMAKGLAATFDYFIVEYFSLSFIITTPLILFLLIRKLLSR